jgi:MoxR-like ATPase
MLDEKEVIRKASITATLEVQGWQHLDAILLAALTTNFPVLLIGPHGTAKTLLVERLAEALGMSFRHYNASLLNYDDLVGIPIPEEGNEHLRFITTPGAIWDAEFVFFDEISRCRPDLQNKLFPIIHERRVVGMNLERLRYRWAAMNPPTPDNADLDSPTQDMYLGSEPLDPALTDRFPYVITVPNWRDLSRDDQRRMLSLRGTKSQNGTVESFHLPFDELVEACTELIPQVEAEYSEWLIDYLIAVMDLLQKASLPQSPRRARMLVESIIAVHAARLVLEGEEAELEDSAEVALLYGLPQNATDVPPSPASIVAIHRQAWEITSMMEDEVWRQILQESDALKRILLGEALQMSDDDISRLVTQALNVDASEARKIGLATALYLHFRTSRHLTPAAWEPLAKLAGRVMLPRQRTSSLVGTAPDMNVYNEIKPFAMKRRTEGKLGELEVNYVLGGYPELWRQLNWKDALNQFREDLKLFGIDEEALA